MKVPFVNFGLAYSKIRNEILEKIDSVLSAGDLILRDDLEEFEKKFADFVGVKYCVGLNSGTDALSWA